MGFTGLRTPKLTKGLITWWACWADDGSTKLCTVIGVVRGRVGWVGMGGCGVGTGVSGVGGITGGGG